MVRRAAVRENPRQIPAALLVLHFTDNRRQSVENMFGILFEIIVSKPVCQVREWPATVGRADIEEFADLRREADNSEIAIQKQRRNVRGCHQVLQVARQCGEFGHFMSIFLIDRLELLVHALQFFLAGLQLFQRRAEFFVGRLQFLVRRLQFLLARFVLFDDALQTLP